MPLLWRRMTGVYHQFKTSEANSAMRRGAKTSRVILLHKSAAIHRKTLEVLRQPLDGVRYCHNPRRRDKHVSLVAVRKRNRTT